ncbi:hypothetical protein HZA73_07185 [candidate division TA06 bacterium]|nr:hypothetical protein [candidate division TA06 bacterium]
MNYITTLLLALLLFTGCATRNISSNSNLIKSVLLEDNISLLKSSYTVQNPHVTLQLKRSKSNLVINKSISKSKSSLTTHGAGFLWVGLSVGGGLIINAQRDSTANVSGGLGGSIITAILPALGVTYLLALIEPTHTKTKVDSNVVESSNWLSQVAITIKLPNGEIKKQLTDSTGKIHINLEDYQTNSDLLFSFQLADYSSFRDSLTIPASFMVQLSKSKEEELARKKAEEEQRRLANESRIKEAKTELANIDNIVKRKGARLTGAISYLMRLEKLSDVLGDDKRFIKLKTKLRSHVDISIVVLALSSSRLEYYRSMGINDFCDYHDDAAIALIRAFGDNTRSAYNVILAPTLEESIELVMRQRVSVEPGYYSSERRRDECNTFTYGIERVFGHEFRKALDKICIPH